MIEILGADMGLYTTYKVGGKADKLLVPESERELVKAILSERRAGNEVFVIGNGSNLLFANDFKGTVIHIGESFSGIEIDDTRVIAGGGALISNVSKAAAKDGLTGFEFAEGIPGSMGGAVFMNAGAYGGEMKDVVQCVTAVDSISGEYITLCADDLKFGYRRSTIKDRGLIVISVTLELEHGEKDKIDEAMRDFSHRRRSKQPLEYPSCGSFFKRPAGYFAGQLIDEAGLRGFSVGGAQVSEKHCGFLINKDNATTDDILTLMKLIQLRVKDKFGVDLEPEVRII